MPIGIAAGAAVVGAGAGIYSASKSAKAQKKAAQTAADSSLQVAQANNDLFRETRAQNVQLASPYYNNGLLAGNALTDLLLGTHTYNPAITANPTIPGGGTFPTTGPGAPGTPGNGGYSGPTFAQILAMPHKGSAYESAFNSFVNYYQAHPNENPGITARGQIDALSGDSIKGSENAMRSIFDAYQASPNKTTAPPATPAPAPAPAPATGALSTIAPGEPATNMALSPQPVAQTEAAATPAAATPAATPTPTALSAWDQFRQGTNYQWRLGEGQKALDGKYSALGMFQSGAADRAAVEYGQNFASNELSNYMNLLAGQQGVGLQAAGAVMGVNTNSANNIAAQNTNAANAAGNAALIAGQAKANQWGAIGQGIGQIGGALSTFAGGGGFGGGGMSNAAANAAMAPGQYPTLGF